MKWQEFLDKENGTTYALDGPRMCDSDMNIMRELAGEADEPCHFCEEPVRPNGDPRGPYWSHTYDEDGEIPVHEECMLDAYEAHLEAKAESRHNQ